MSDDDSEIVIIRENKNNEEKTMSINDIIADAEAMLNNIESNIPISSNNEALINNDISEDDVSMSSTSFTTLSSVSNIDYTTINTTTTPLISSSTWKDLNVLLRRNSFPELDDPNNKKDMQKVLNVFTEIAEQYEKRGKLIEEMVNRMGRNSPIKSDYIDPNEMEKLRRKKEKLEKEVTMKHIKIETLEKEKLTLQRSYLTKERQLNQKIDQLKQKLQFSKRENREQEERSELLQKQLQKSIDKHVNARNNAEKTFSKMMKRPPRGTSTADETMVQLIEVFNEQQLSREQEIVNLKAQVRSLSSVIMEHENTLIRHGIVNHENDHVHAGEENNEINKTTTTSHINSTSSSTSEHLNISSTHSNLRSESNLNNNNNNNNNNSKNNNKKKDKNNNKSMEQLDDEEIKLSDKNLFLTEQLKVHRLKRQLVEVRNEFERRERHYVKHLQAAENELTSRQNKLEEFQNNIDMLEADLESRPSVNQWRECQQELEDLQKKFSHSQNIRDLSKYVDTRELIRRDKELHELGLRKLEHLPHSVAIELLQDICRELQLNDVGEILSSLNKMSLVIGAVPAMESFIHEISQTVLSVSKVIGCSQAMRQPKSIAELLDNIIPTLKSWETLFLSLSGESAFRRRVIDELRRRVIIDDNIEGRELLIIRHLVDVEARAQHSLETLDSMNVFVKERPDEVVNQFISQFCKLFNVEKPQSIFSRLNHIYVTFNEMKNGYHTLQSLLELDTTDVSHVVAAVQELQYKHKATDDDNNNNNNSDDNKSEPTTITTAAKYRDIIRKLKILLGTDVDNLYDTCHELVVQIRRYNELLPNQLSQDSS